jgi:hypothetical protein
MSVSYMVAWLRDLSTYKGPARLGPDGQRMLVAAADRLEQLLADVLENGRTS